jgi:hypothetical protein
MQQYPAGSVTAPVKLAVYLCVQQPARLCSWCCGTCCKTSGTPLAFILQRVSFCGRGLAEERDAAISSGRPMTRQVHSRLSCAQNSLYRPGGVFSLPYEVTFGPSACSDCRRLRQTSRVQVGTGWVPQGWHGYTGAAGLVLMLTEVRT